MRPKTIPHKIHNAVDVVNQYAIDSGKRCKNASPNNAHAEKLTIQIRNFFNFSVLIAKVTIPISAIALTKRTLPNA